MCSFNIKGLTPEDDGEYTCTAVNCAGEASLTVSIQRDVKGNYSTAECLFSFGQRQHIG